MFNVLATAPPQAKRALLEDQTDDEKIIELWLLHRHNPNTRKSYLKTIETLLTFIPNGLRSVKLEQLARWTDSIAHNAAATRQTRISTVRSLFRFMRETGFIDVDPARFMRPPRVPDQLAERILPEDETVRLVTSPRAGSRDSAILRLLYVTGCRAAELTGLSWGDLQPRKDGKYQVLLRGKGDKNRSVMVEDEALVADLLRLRREAFKIGGSDSSPMFVSKRSGRRIRREDVFRMVRKWAAVAGLDPKKVCVHTMRHCHATHALENGAPIMEVAATLGHRDLKTTQRYAHVRPGQSSGRFINIGALTGGQS